MDQATEVTNAIDAGAQTEAKFISGLFLQAANTTIPAVAVEGSMYGALGTAAEITLLATQFLPGQLGVALQYGFNPQVYTSEALGLALAFGNATGDTSFADAYGPSNPALANSVAGELAFATAATVIFGSALTENLVNVMDTWVTNWKSFYSANGIPGFLNPTPDQVDLAARGAAMGRCGW